MNKCLKITLALKVTQSFKDVLQKTAKKLNLEGIAQGLPDNVFRIIVCGSKEDVDMFLDFLHKNSGVNGFEIEPFLKDRDYRGVFRIIE